MTLGLIPLYAVLGVYRTLLSSFRDNHLCRLLPTVIVNILKLFALYIFNSIYRYRMNEIFATLRDKFPFLSLIRKGDLEYVGIVQNEDVNVISFYDYGRLMMPQDKMKFLKCGETWWHESNRKLPINIFLKGDFRYFRTTLVTLNSKDVEIVHGPTVRLSDISKKRVKRRTIQLVRRPV